MEVIFFPPFSLFDISDKTTKTKKKREGSKTNCQSEDIVIIIVHSNNIRPKVEETGMTLNTEIRSHQWGIWEGAIFFFERLSELNVLHFE